MTAIRHDPGGGDQSMSSEKARAFGPQCCYGCMPTKQNEDMPDYRTIKQPQLNLPAELTKPNRRSSTASPVTFGDNVTLGAELYDVLEQCNIDRAAIRQLESSAIINKK